MRVIVIGAAGHIGTYLIPMLVNAGYETNAITPQYTCIETIDLAVKSYIERGLIRVTR